MCRSVTKQHIAEFVRQRIAVPIGLHVSKKEIHAYQLIYRQNDMFIGLGPASGATKDGESVRYDPCSTLIIQSQIALRRCQTGFWMLKV